jgi:phenylacetate-CoA ligase
MFSIYHLAAQTLHHYVNELRRTKLPWLHGYPSALCLLANYIIENEVGLGYRARWITAGAENLLENQAAVIHRAFGVKPVQHYGMAEAVANISECEQGNLHVDEDFAAVEFLPDETAGASRIVGTNFSNYATPFLRYDTQDFATVQDGSCSCGRPGRIVARIDGRQEDFIVLANGARIGRMDHVFKDLVRIREAQIYQERPGALVVRIVKGSGYSPDDERGLLGELRKRVGAQCEIAVVYCTELERSRTGKLRFVVSKA